MRTAQGRLRGSNTGIHLKGKGNAKLSVAETHTSYPYFRYTQDLLQIFLKISINILQLQPKVRSDLQNICGPGFTADLSQMHLQTPLSYSLQNVWGLFVWLFICCSFCVCLLFCFNVCFVFQSLSIPDTQNPPSELS